MGAERGHGFAAEKANQQAGTVDRRFRLHDGVRLRGTLEWSKLASDGTAATREAPLEL
ncbi:hypothetical protein [Paenibacillus sp. yr247]|uniref:hypothetical protein n=1 Tax=Paenibacillus sp. yr247 TaxID=1761880 RepID=UPI001587682C|nr:hypothetical protein [Paenibacillus sp. yr247]